MLLYGGIGYWVWFGSFYLLLLALFDVKNKGWVDDRKNYFMMGLSFSLMSHIRVEWWYLFLVVGISLGLMWGLRKFKALGDADVNSLTWIFYGFGLINPFKLLWFVIFLAVVTGLYLLIKRFLYSRRAGTPFYPVIFVCFVFNCWMFGMY